MNKKNMLKKTASVMVSMALTASMAAANIADAYADGDEFCISSDDSRYTYIAGTGQTASIAACRYSKNPFKGVLKIPDVIDGLDVTGICDNAFNGNDITSVSIPKAVTEIGSLAFSNCLLLTEASIPDNITKMGTMAFSQTPYESNLLKNSRDSDFAIIKNYILYLYTGTETEITVPEGVTVIAGSAFANNGINSDKEIKSVTFSQSTQYVGDNVFDNCKGLQKVVFRENIKSISEDAFPPSFKGIIYGYSGSAAQKFADANEYKFAVISKEGVITGDANRDGYINVRDAAFVARALAEGKKDELPRTADFNEDGDINVRDAASLAKFLATGKK